MRDNELFSNGAVYHVYNRGVDRRATFADDWDRLRFIKGMIAFNDIGRRANKSLSAVDVPAISENPYVEIVAYCLMPNHFHLMLVQKATGGISEFMRRIGTGYTQYFNKRNNRSGSLFETTFKVKRVTNSVQMRHLSRYIHLNPLELIGLNWKKGRVSWDIAESFLKTYSWSSFRHFIGLEARAFIHPEKALKNVGAPNDYVRFLSSWIERDRKRIDAFESLATT